MSPPLFLVDTLPAGDAYRLDGPEGHHAAAVQRLRAGESIILADGRGGLADAKVSAGGRGYLDVVVGRRRFEPPEVAPFTVVQGIAKGDRGELAVQAMTEVGVDVIVAWQAERSVARWKDARPLQRWRVTAREATKQARRGWLPTITEPESTAQVAERLRSTAVALVLDEGARTALSGVDLATAGTTGVVIVVGPEGGITPTELAAFAAAGATAVRLGPSVLRTSTAGVAALAALSVRLGRW